MKIYLAGPINGCTDEQANGWRNEATRIATEYDHVCLTPMVRDYRGREAGAEAEIVQGDKADILKCQAVLLYYEKPSVGTAQEQLFAWERGIPVAVVNKSDKPLPPWLVYHAAGIFKSLGEAIAHIDTIRWPVRRINTYTVKFISNCAVNGTPIDYHLQIETPGAQVMVEDILTAIGKDATLHEALADRLYAQFGGHQTLTAHHHGVIITTVRG
jgi:nucleoside 2-deoxyribosyltransferase